MPQAKIQATENIYIEPDFDEPATPSVPDSWAMSFPEEPPKYEGVAGNPGNLQISFARWSWYFDYKSYLIILLPLVFGIFILCVDPFVKDSLAIIGIVSFGIGCVAAVVHTFNVRKQFQQVEEFYINGDANPAIVLSLNPVLIAVYTDLRRFDECYPVIKIMKVSLKQSCGEPLKVGSYLATVAGYCPPDSPEIEYWADFYPQLVDYVAGKDQIDKVMATFPEEFYRNLHDGLQHVPKPYKPGLYALWPEPGKELGRRI